ILKTKKRGNYCVIQIDPNYVPAEIERKQVFGVTFEQGRNNIEITPDLFTDIVSKNKDLPDFAIRDLIISMITLKYTQSNSVCYVKDGQAIGIGAGQQSRIHCTRLAGDKADKWYLRQSPQVLNLQFVDTLKRAERDNAIDVYLSEDWEDVNGDDNWQDTFKVRPEVFTRQAQKEWLKTNKNVVLGSDAFFPFGDNMERAHRSGVVYVGEAGGSVRDDNVIEVADKYNMVLAFTHVRLFHH
ncbi:MAG TPA: phosphoribosylaminoimidazolecarboxamide formyltransferase, partial [Erysipelotrichaceae bacterium]|nr:phosphoribosylaminoimidazolecarboxamide formyltransferase [Erysipelotrichaceae bacterium]